MTENLSSAAHARAIIETLLSETLPTGDRPVVLLCCERAAPRLIEIVRGAPPERRADVLHAAIDTGSYLCREACLDPDLGDRVSEGRRVTREHARFAVEAHDVIVHPDGSECPDGCDAAPMLRWHEHDTRQERMTALDAEKQWWALLVCANCACRWSVVSGLCRDCAEALHAVEACAVDPGHSYCHRDGCCERTRQCSFWGQAEFRRADDSGFGFTPPMSRADWEQRELEDEHDPPCGACPACLEAESLQDSGPDWDRHARDAAEEFDNGL